MKQTGRAQFEIGRPQTHRVLVRSADTRPKSFIWEIIHEDRPGRPIEASGQSFPSMEAAYTHGADALAKYLAKHTEPPRS